MASILPRDIAAPTRYSPPAAELGFLLEFIRPSIRLARGDNKQLRCSYRALDLRVICADNLAMAQPMDRSGLEGALAALGDLVAYRGEAYEIVLVGGGDLVLRGIISRSTKDADIVGQRLSNGRIVPLHRLPDAQTLAHNVG